MTWGPIHSAIHIDSDCLHSKSLPTYPSQKNKKYLKSKKTKSCTLNAQEDVRCEMWSHQFRLRLVLSGLGIISHSAPLGLGLLSSILSSSAFLHSLEISNWWKKSSPNRFYIDFRGILSESKLVLLLNRFICAYLHRNIFSPSPSHGILL